MNRIPRLWRFAKLPYHYALAAVGALYYRFPAKKIFLIGVTGTKGKTTTAELVNAILEEAGYRTALSDTIRFKIAEESRPNLYKMTLPGRFFIQRFLAQAVAAECTHAIVEISSEAALQYRHRFLYLDALIFTNLAPEHLESHGSYEKYVAAKLEIGKRVLRSGKSRTLLVVNADDKEAKRFEALGVRESLLFSLTDAAPYTSSPDGSTFTFRKVKIWSRLPGEFSIYNMLAALTLGEALGVKLGEMKEAIEKFPGVRGRAEKIDAGQSFSVIVDYAHTPDSLEALYKAYPGRKICIFGATGGGRDRWKRPVMGEVASRHCEEIVLTDDDAYDEDPALIAEHIKRGIPKNLWHKVSIEPDRRKAIAFGLSLARRGDTVLITGKGTDPYLMGPRGRKLPWNDAAIAEEELRALLSA